LSQPHKIVLFGFSSFEKVTFESFFRLAARRAPGYALVDDASQAQLAVVNADDQALLRQCMANRPAKYILLIGAQDGGTGWPIQRRPLNLMKVLASVESLLNSSGSAATIPAPLMPMSASAAARPVAPAGMRVPAASSLPGPQASAAKALQPASPTRSATPVAGPDSVMLGSVRTGAGALPSSDFAALSENFFGKSAKSIQPKPQEDVDHILVVDDSDIALKFMRNRLSRFGFHADLVHSGEDALAKMNTKPYKFVFLDVMMEGLDGYQTCRAIKQRKYSDGKPPVVVMLTSRGGTIDKIRGTLAGCDAYLTKPLNEQDLISVLAKHDRTTARGFQETNFGDDESGFRRSK
jgi:two-component system, cell cycle response regulator